MTSKGGKRKKGLNREILSTSPGIFHKMLKSKAGEAGVIYKEINTRKVKPSQTCSGCGEQKKKGLSERQHACPNCGSKLSRDENASRVILNAVLKETGWEPTRCGERSKDFSLKHETPFIPTLVG